MTWATSVPILVFLDLSVLDLGAMYAMRLRFNVLSIDYVRVTNCFYDYDYDSQTRPSWRRHNNMTNY